MANPYGITLKPAWTEWAAKLGVSETIAAAVYLLGEARNAEEVVVKLNPGEIERVIDIVGHQPDRFPPGILATLKEGRSTSPKAIERAARAEPPHDRPDHRADVTICVPSVLKRACCSSSVGGRTQYANGCAAAEHRDRANTQSRHPVPHDQAAPDRS